MFPLLMTNVFFQHLDVMVKLYIEIAYNHFRIPDAKIKKKTFHFFFTHAFSFHVNILCQTRLLLICTLYCCCLLLSAKTDDKF